MADPTTYVERIMEFVAITEEMRDLFNKVIEASPPMRRGTEPLESIIAAPHSA
ncbi:MAG TPA: hypothetical protein VK901_10940 [Nitrospiraceae bacterium]|nr:hypothetical protein [Nitrospiraceae bacterium]